MRTLIDFAIREEYSRVKALGDDLSGINSLIKWDRFRFLEPLIYKNKTRRGGRPNIDIVIMVKTLVLQSWFGLSDPELERQVTDRISFRIFLGTTEVIPDFSTVWLFRERLIECDRYEDLWKELQMQLDEKGFIVKKGTIQDATFITSDPGKKRNKKGNYSAYLDQQLSPHSSKFRISTRLNLSFGYEVDRYWFLFGMEARRDYSHFSKPPSYDRFKEAE